MSMTVMQLEQAIERAERKGRQADVEKLRFLLGEVTGDGAVNQAPGHVYTVLEGDDVFGISEMLLGSIEYVPDLLKANPDTNFATGDEIVVPDVGGDEATAAASDAAALVELFETKGPPNDSWTVEDYALLEAVQAQVAGPVDPELVLTGNTNGNGGTGGGQGGQIEVVEENAEDVEERTPAASTAVIDLPAEDAEIIAQFMAQMIMNGVVPDGSAWGPGSVGEEGRRERERDLGPDDPGDGGEVREYQSWEDRQRAEQREALIEKGTLLPEPEVIYGPTSTPSPTTSVPYDPEMAQTTILDFVTSKPGYGSAEDFETFQTSIQLILQEAAKYELTIEELAYILATVEKESLWGKTPIEINTGIDYEGRLDLGNIYPEDGKRFIGRGLVQITGRDNYQRMTDVLAYNGITHNGEAIDLVENPDLAAEPEISAFVAVYGMVTGFFTGKKLEDFKGEDGTYDFIGARAIVNSFGESDEEIAVFAQAYLPLLEQLCVTPGGLPDNIKCN